MIQHEEH